jgi:hypothetical protein
LLISVDESLPLNVVKSEETRQFCVGTSAPGTKMNIHESPLIAAGSAALWIQQCLKAATHFHTGLVIADGISAAFLGKCMDEYLGIDTAAST